ncbi:hypothetical protein AAFF_G00099120 [Aldrovandia affinis]|uniref:Methyltransferase type 11 domain-containing protein n=1 Tax=Aldrovandia affinis TaxID=143900 RepID=A0AAD7WBS0_9TELE|nr:hypothetical protein AAFF_G00099120 [Aldrovandia affinis]
MREDEQRHFLDRQESQDQAADEYARALGDAQTRLAQKEAELRKAAENHASEAEQLRCRVEQESRDTHQVEANALREQLAQLEKSVEQVKAQNQELQTEQEKFLAQRDDVSSQLQEVNRANSRLLEQLTERGQEKDKLQQALEETRKTADKRKAMLDELAMDVAQEKSRHKEELSDARLQHEKEVLGVGARYEKELRGLHEDKNRTEEEIRSQLRDEKARTRELESLQQTGEVRLQEAKETAEKSALEHQEQVQKLQLEQTAQLQGKMAEMEAQQRATEKSFREVLKVQAEAVLDLQAHLKGVVLQSIAEDLRACLPVEAMLPSESLAIEKAQQNPKPTVHVDAFLYDEEAVDSLCEEGKMSRDYCLHCGSHRTAPLGFISHSFSALELRFLFQNVLPDLSGKVLVDVGSRLGAVLYGGCLYSSAAQLVGVEISAEFTELQRMVVEKYGFTDQVQVIHADICTQASLLQNADVVVMNNVFEYFLESNDQMRAWHCISQNVSRKGALLVTVPGVQESLAALQGSNEAIDIHQWLEELPLDYDVYLGRDTDTDSFKQIHLYRVL